MATGLYEDAARGRHGMIATLSAGSWSASTAPLASSPAPAANPLVILAGLTCPTAGSCVATDTYEDATGHEDGLIDRFSDGT